MFVAHIVKHVVQDKDITFRQRIFQCIAMLELEMLVA